MAIHPILSLGLPVPHTTDTKKFGSAECLAALIDKIANEPHIIRNQFNIVTKDQNNEMQAKFWPALFDTSAWTRLATHRPKEDENGEKLYGTDREVREYENDVWADDNKMVKGWVTTEYGEIIDIKVLARW